MSIIGITGNMGQSNYAASNAALTGFNKSLAIELAGKNITVNVVALGFTATDMVEHLPGQVKENLIQMILMKRFARPDEVGSMVSYLASPSSGYITGRSIYEKLRIPVNGLGRSIHRERLHSPALPRWIE